MPLVMPLLATVALAVSPSAPKLSTIAPSTIASVARMCDPSVDPNCYPVGGTAIEQLVSGLTTDIQALNISPTLKTALEGYVNQLPAGIAGLTPTQRLRAIAGAQALVRYVEFAPPGSIPEAQAAEIVRLGNLLIAALSS
jgi:hypothetical protein